MDVFPADLRTVLGQRHGEFTIPGYQHPRRYYFGYHDPDEYYEALLKKLVAPGCRWLDVGGGREVFPQNRELARDLARRAGAFIGLDPDPTVHENAYVHRAVQATIEEYENAEPFDLITSRMAAEHFARPAEALSAMARLLRPGGKMVVYTVNKWTPVAMAAWAVPHGLHHPIKNRVWGTKKGDTFPVAYKLNTPRTLTRAAEAAGFRTLSVDKLADCRAFFRFKALNYAELIAWRACKAVGVTYPENCLLGVFEKA